MVASLNTRAMVSPPAAGTITATSHCCSLVLSSAEMAPVSGNVVQSFTRRFTQRFVTTERAYTRAFSWLKVASLGTDNSVFNLKAVVATFNQEMAMVGAFSVIKHKEPSCGWTFV